MNKQKLTNKIEPETGKQNRECPEESGEGDNDGKKGKGLVENIHE